MFETSDAARGPRASAGRGKVARTRELHFLDDLAAVHVAGTFAKLGEGRNVLLDLLVFDCGRGAEAGFVREQMLHNTLFFWGSGGGRRRVIAPPGGRDRAIEQKGRRESVDREWICRLARRRRIDGGTASIAAPPKPATLWRRKVGPEPTGRTLGRKNCPAGHLPATSRQHIATSWREVFGTLTLLSTRSCGGLEAMDRQFGGFRGVRGRRGHKPGIARAASAIERVVGRAGILKKSSPCTAPRGPRWWGRTRSQRTPRVSTR